MTCKNKNSAKLTRRTLAAAFGRETADKALQQLTLREHGRFRIFGLSGLLMGSASVAALTLALSAQAQEASPTPVPDISVNAPPPQTQNAATEGQPLDGSAAAGYRVENTTTTGPWGTLPLQDTPYSINVMSQDLIQNVQASAPDQLLKMNPVVQLTQPIGINGRPTFNIRGFNIKNSQEDGMRDFNGWGNPLEEYERVEVLSGLSGFLYGSGNVGGMVNYVTKRPTPAPLADITVGDFGGANYYVHGDFGGPIDKDGMFAYRLNLLTQNGDQGPDLATQRRNLVSGAVDWHIMDHLVVELIGTYFDYKQNGVPAAWSTSGNFQYPAAPNVDLLWSQPWTYQTLETSKIGGNVKWDLNEIFTLRGAYRHAEYDDQNLTAFNNIQPNDTYTQLTQTRAPRTLVGDSAYAFLDAHFDTYFVDHRLTFGFYGDRNIWLEHPDEQAAVSVPGNFSLITPIYALQPLNIVGTQPAFKDTAVSNTNFVLGDILKFNEYWSAMVGANYATVNESDWNTPGRPPSFQYNKSAVTPSASLLFKPTPWVTTYATFIQSLEEGAIVPNSGSVIYTNAGQILAPVISDEYEIGAKATLGGMFVTAALFQINKANDYSINNGNGTNTFKQDGREVHKGVELVATGNIMEGLRLFGGVTVFNAAVEQTSDPTLIGKQPANVSEQMLKAYAEYDIPYVPGLTLTGGAYYTSSFYADAANTQPLPGVIIGDVGLRYTTKIEGQPLTMRVNVTNVANKSYWLNSNYEGDPRRIAFNFETKF